MSLEGVRFGVEVELARKSVERLGAIVGLHARWRAAGQTGGVMYVCADEAGAERVREIAAERGLSTARGGGLRVELLVMRLSSFPKSAVLLRHLVACATMP